MVRVAINQFRNGHILKINALILQEHPSAPDSGEVSKIAAICTPVAFPKANFDFSKLRLS